jgi:uncharacterized membrane protein YraQ (UPF0718 family)
MNNKNQNNNQNQNNTLKVFVDGKYIELKSAIDRTFELLEQKKFSYASQIVNQIVTVDYLNTDALIANFLFKHRLSNFEAVANDFNNYDKFIASDLYKRIKNCQVTELSKILDLSLEKAQKLKEENQKQIKRQKKDNFDLNYLKFAVIGMLIAPIIEVIYYQEIIMTIHQNSRDDILTIMSRFFKFWMGISGLIVIALFGVYGMYKGFKILFQKLK